MNQDAEHPVVLLVRQAQAGDQTAYAGLFERYQRSIFNVMYQLVRDREDAADLTQETFVRAFRHLSRLQAPEAFGTWLRRIAVNIGRDHLKRRRLPTEPLTTLTGGERAVESPDESLDRVAIRRELVATIRTAIARLPEDHRLVVILHHLDGLPVAEIAEVLDIPVGTVKSRLARARAALRDLLAPYLEEVA